MRQSRLYNNDEMEGSFSEFPLKVEEKHKNYEEIGEAYWRKENADKKVRRELKCHI